MWYILRGCPGGVGKLFLHGSDSEPGLQTASQTFRAFQEAWVIVIVMVWENRAVGAGMTTGDTIRLTLRWETVFYSKYGFGTPIHDLVYFLPDFWFWQNLWFTLGICQSLGGWLARSDSFQINPVSQARSYRSRPAWSHTCIQTNTYKHTHTNINLHTDTRSSQPKTRNLNNFSSGLERDNCSLLESLPLDDPKVQHNHFARTTLFIIIIIG